MEPDVSGETHLANCSRCRCSLYLCNLRCRRCWPRRPPRSPTGDGWLYEPKWDGFRCIVFRDGDEIELASRNERPFTRYFPELLEPLLAALPDRCVVDGEIVVPADDDRGLDFDALLQRIHPAESRRAPAGRRDAGVVRRLRPAGARRRRHCSTVRSASATDC